MHELNAQLESAREACATEKAVIFPLKFINEDHFGLVKAGLHFQAEFASLLYSMISSREHFYAVLKTEFAPRLRAVAFKGTGQNFRRVAGDMIHAINIQGNKWGDSCTVNLGLHLTFLPDTLQVMPDLKTIKEIDCEFRFRMFVDEGRDQWWLYGTTPMEAEQSARSLIATYFDFGEPHFSRYNQPTALVAELEQIVFGHRPAEHWLQRLSLVRAALAGARIHLHYGNLAESKRFARAGLNHIRNPVGIALREELNALAQDTDKLD